MNQSNFVRSLRFAGIGVLCAGLLAACGAPAINSKLAIAQAVYKQAEASSAIAATPTAQVYLHKAGEALAKAEKAEETADVEHYAYLAEQQAKTALEMAKRKHAEKEVETLRKEKTEVVMMAREKEIARARAEAEARAREADARAREAETALEQARKAREEAAELTKQTEQLKKQLSELEAKQTARGLVLTLGDVLFETGKASLLSGATNNIDKLAKFLNENPERQILIEGHTDNVGSETYNLELSRNRANSVRNALLDRGIESSRIRTEGYGESRPVASNESSSGRQQNRRVEIVILDAPKKPQ